MDAKVKAMIKLIEEDADSFARRAEMYYKKRPELMKLVEEFYRAYRALAERYDHATGELRQAHRTMAQAFPDLVLGDDTPSGSEPDTPETPHPIRAFFDPDFSSSSQGTKRTGASLEESDKVISRKGLKQLNDIFRSDEWKMREKNLEAELQILREALAKLEAEKVAIFLQYQLSLDKLSNLEKNLNHVENDSRGLDNQAYEAKAEIQALNEALRKMEAERDASLLQYQQSLEKLAAAEGLVLEAQEDAKGLRERAVKVETKSQRLSRELARLEAKKEAAELLYKQFLAKIAALESNLALAEENLKTINERSSKAESEVKALKEEIRKLNEERDPVALKYEQCLKTISTLQHELNEARADNGRLNSEILLGSAKLKGAENQCVLLGKMNESLQLEAQNLAQRIAAADQELSRKQSNLEKLMGSLQDEHSRFVQAEATLYTLQNLHSQSQEEQKAVALELRNGLQMMEDLEKCKQDLEVEIQRLKDENQTLNDLNSSSSISQKNLQDETVKLKEMKEKLEAEVRRQAEQSDALQLLVQNLKGEIEGLYRRYQDLMQQMESVKGLQDENLRLKETSMKDKVDREALITKLQDMEELLEKNAVLESSLSEVNVELERSKEKAEVLKECCRDLSEEKSTLITEKAALLSQLKVITETMQSLLERNTSLQNSLCGATAELEGLRVKSKGLEEFCQLLSSERSNVVAERSSLVSRLEMVEQKLEKLEMRFTNLEDKHSGLEKEKQSTLSQVEELRISLDVEKQERQCLVSTSEARLSGLEGRIHDLKEETKCRKREFEEQLEKSVNAQVEIFILQKFIQDMEDKNFSLLVECQRHVEATKYSEKLITELESENMIQQVESEILLDKIDMLREGINQVLKALEIKHGGETEAERKILPCVVENIRNIKSSLSESKDKNQQLLIEKSVLSTILGQLHFECVELSSKKTTLEQESLLLAEQLVTLEDEKHLLLERSKQLNVEVDEREKREETLKAEAENLHAKLVQLGGSYVALEEENLKTLKQNRFLEEELQQIKDEKHSLEEENSEILIDALAFSYQSVILKSYEVEKLIELDIIAEDLKFLGKSYRDLEGEAKRLEEKLRIKETENLALKASMEKLEEKQFELSACNDKLRCQITDGRELLSQKETELSEKEQKLKVEGDTKTELCTTIQCLEKEHEALEVTRVVLSKQIVELSEHGKCQEEEIVHLREVNGNLESEVGKLAEELEECKLREVILTSELHERSSEFELWEAEAASFYFDLHISSVREALFQNKVHELGSLCEDLEDVSNRRSVEIERMKVRVSFLETEAEALKSQLTTCLPLIASLKDNIAMLEENPVLQSKLHPTSSSQQEEASYRMEEISSSQDTLLELQKLLTRIKIIEDILEKEKGTAAMQEQANTNTRLEAALKEIEYLKARINTNNQEEHRQSCWESVSATSGVKISTEMKDIPLDQASGRSFHGVSQRDSAVSEEQMLELWEAAEEDCCHDHQLIGDLQEQGTDPIEDEIVYARSGDVDQVSLDPTPESQYEKELGVDTFGISRKEGTKKNVLERLGSDAQKLKNIQISVQELKRKTEPYKRRKKTEDAEYEGFRGKLKEMQNSVVQLMDLNMVLTRTIEESSLTSDGRGESELEEAKSIRQQRVSEQARKEAEKIGKLELEMQRIQYALLRLMDEKKSKGKGSVSRSNAAVLLRDFFYSRERKSKKPKKSRFCGCLRPAPAKT